jgi:predicted ATPase
LVKQNLRQDGPRLKPPSKIQPEQGIDADPASSPAGLFAGNADLWTVGLSGSNITIPAVKGLGYIQRLLQHPGQEFHSLDLVRVSGSVDTSAKETADHAALIADPAVKIGELGDSGEMLDPRAIQEYRRRLNELKAELEEVRESDNYNRGVKIEDEIDALEREISRAVGIGGRVRRAGSEAERARLNATRAIKGAVQKIRERHAALADLLEQRIRTGTFCQYVDEPPSVRWSFSISAGAPVPPASPEPFVKRDDSLPQITAAVNRTTFVGRETERESIRQILAEVQRGVGRAVAVCGPPGVGKTRIALEVAAEAESAGFMTLVGHCYDRKDSVPYIPFVEILESALAQSSPPQTFRDALGHNAPEVARLIPQLRRVFDDIPPPLEVSAEQSRRILFDAIAALLARAASESPVLLLLDDMHWADEGTLSLLSHLARSIVKQPVLLMLTYRDDELEPAGALARSLDDLIRLHLLERVELRGLPRSGVAAMILALSGHQPPPNFVDLIHSYTDGNPFFIEELIKHLLERGRLLDASGEIRRDFKSDEVDVPQSLRLVIGRRLARLSDATQKVLGVASVIGPSFSFELLEGACGIDPDSLLDCVEEAEGLSLITSRLVRLESRFEFPHELVRQAVLGGISPARRQRLHLSVATAIERIYADSIEEHAADLAHHLWQAGSAATDAGKTLRFMRAAARRGLEQSGYEFALGQMARALEMVKKLPESRERNLLELDLQIDNGVAILATRGWYVPEMGSAYQRARELCQALGEDSRLFQVSYGLWSFHLVRGEHQIARTYADEMLRLVPQADDEGIRVLADWASGCSQFFMGEFKAAHLSLEHSIQGYDRDRDRGLALRFGQDPCVSARCYDAMTLWVLGFPDEAEHRASAALSLARELGHPFTLAWCLSNLVMYRLLGREIDSVNPALDEGLAITREYGFAFYEEQFLAFQNLALMARGIIERPPLGSQKRHYGEGYDLAGTWARCVIAEAFGATPRTDIALKVLNEASELMERNGERFADAEIQRARGEVLLRQTVRAGEHDAAAMRTEAEGHMRDAIDAARKRGGRMLELRASTSLAKLLIRADKTTEANAILKTALAGFAEGLNTPDLRAARELLSGPPPGESNLRSASVSR